MDLNSAGFAVFPAEFNRDLLVVATYAQIMTCLLVFTQTREYMSLSVIPVLQFTAIVNCEARADAFFTLKKQPTLIHLEWITFACMH